MILCFLSSTGSQAGQHQQPRRRHERCARRALLLSVVVASGILGCSVLNESRAASRKKGGGAGGEAPADVDPMALDTRLVKFSCHCSVVGNFPRESSAQCLLFVSCPASLCGLPLLGLALHARCLLCPPTTVVNCPSLPCEQHRLQRGGRAGRARARAQGDGRAAAALPRGQRTPVFGHRFPVLAALEIGFPVLLVVPVCGSHCVCGQCMRLCRSVAHEVARIVLTAGSSFVHRSCSRGSRSRRRAACSSSARRERARRWWRAPWRTRARRAAKRCARLARFFVDNSFSSISLRVLSPLSVLFVGGVGHISS